MARVYRKGTGADTRRLKKRTKRHCRSAPEVPANLTLTFHRREIRKREVWRAKAAWDPVTVDVAGRTIDPERYEVQLRATDASGDPVETQLQAQSAVAYGEDFTVHAGSVTFSGKAAELTSSPDEIKKTLTGLTAGIEVGVQFFARKNAGGSSPTIKCEIWNVTDAVSVASKNATPDSAQRPKVVAARSFTPVGGKTYEARVSWQSGTGTALLHQIQWQDKGDEALWRSWTSSDDEPTSRVFSPLARPGSWYYQTRVRVLNRNAGHRCYSAWSDWTSPVNPATGDEVGPPAVTGVTLTLDKVEGSRKRPWRAKVWWNETPWWIPPDDDPVQGSAGYHVQLQVSNNGGTTVANHRRKTVEADPTETIARAEFGNIRGRRHYRARVRPFDSEGRLGAWSGWTAWQSPNGAPNPVQNLAWSNPKPALLVAKWDPPADLTDVDRYRVRVFRQPGLVLVDEGFTAGNRWRYDIPVADRGSNHRVRVNVVEDELVLDIDEDAPTGWDTGDASTDTDSSDVANTEQWTADDIDTGTLPPPDLTDGNAPSSSPTPSVTAGPGYLHLTWDAVLNADPVTYEIHVSQSASFTPSSSTLAGEIRGTSYFLRTDGDGEQLPYNTDLYVRMIAKDADGSAAAGSEVGPVELEKVKNVDLAVNAVTANKILAGEVLAEKLAAFLVLASTITTAESGQRVVIDTGGITLFDSEDNIIASIPTDGDPYFRATVEALGLTVLDALTLRAPLTAGKKNVIEAGASVVLEQALSDPSTAPALATVWDTIDLGISTLPADGTKRGLHYSADGGTPYFYFGYHEPGGTKGAGGPYIVKVDTSGAFVESKELPQDLIPTRPRYSHIDGIVRLSGSVYALAQRVDNGTHDILKYNPSGWSLTSTTSLGANEPNASNTLLGFGTDGTDLFVASIRDSDDKLVVDKWSTTPSFTSRTVTGYTSSGGGAIEASGFYGGSADFGAARWVITFVDPAAGFTPYVKVFDTSGVEQANDSFPAPNNQMTTGIAYDGTRFYTLPYSSSQLLLVQHSTFKWTTESAKFWLRYTWVDDNGTASAGSRPLGGDDFESARSPVASITHKKRAKLRVTTSDLPASVTHVGLYMDRGSTEPTLDFQTDSTTKTHDFEGFSSGGAAPPTSSSFPNATPATFESSDGSPLLRGDGMSRVTLAYAGGANVGNTTPEYVRFGTETADTDNYHATSTDALSPTPDSTYEITLPFTGQYLVIGRAQWATSGTGYRHLSIETNKSGSFAQEEAFTVPAAAAVNTRVSWPMVLNANAGNKLRMALQQNSGAGLALLSAKLNIIFLGPT